LLTPPACGAASLMARCAARDVGHPIVAAFVPSFLIFALFLVYRPIGMWTGAYGGRVSSPRYDFPSSVLLKSIIAQLNLRARKTALPHSPLVVDLVLTHAVRLSVSGRCPSASMSNEQAH
jgi:hypothetical protein